MFKQHWSKLSWAENSFTPSLPSICFSLPKGKLKMSNSRHNNNNLFAPQRQVTK